MENLVDADIRIGDRVIEDQTKLTKAMAKNMETVEGQGPSS